jgi:transcriptional regulator with XRE-family HTH domain
LGVTREWYSLIENGDVVRVAPDLLERIARLYELCDRDLATLYELAAPEIVAGALRGSVRDAAIDDAEKIDGDAKRAIISLAHKIEAAGKVERWAEVTQLCSDAILMSIAASDTQSYARGKP